MGIPLFRLIYRKMWNTRWLTVSTLLGLIVAVSFTTSIPMYADGALKRVVAQALQERSDGLPAGSILMRYQASGNERADLDDLQNAEKYIREEVPDSIHFPYEVFAAQKAIRGTAVTPVDPNKVDPSKRRVMSIITMSDLQEHAEISGGSLFSDQVKDGEIEAVVLEESRFRNDFKIGDEFNYPVPGGKPLKVKVVGTYQPKDNGDAYWYQGLDGLVNAFVVSDKVFNDELLTSRNIALNMATWFYSFDLREIKTSQLGPLSRALDRIDIEVYQKLKNTRLDLSFQSMLSDFRKISLQLQTLLLTLAAPMIAMVFYYIAMNSRQALEKQRSDIAVLRSRGGSTRQIILVFLLEGLILGALALLAGPLIGWFMAKSIGSSSGFLTFVDRKSIPVDVSWNTLFYGVAAVVIAIIASVIPAILFARSSIVGLKQQLARSNRQPFWQKWFLDVALLGLVAYGYYLFEQQQILTLQTGMTSDELQVQPLLFFVPALAIFAFGLCFLRIFPWLLRLFNWLGKSFLPVPLYLTLTQLSRSAKSYYPIMILLILTLGLGIYNSSAARTIDLNSTERMLYQYGADVQIQTRWEAISNTLPTVPDFDEEQGNQGEGEQGSGGESGSGGSGQGSGNSGGNNNGAPPGGGETPPQQLLYEEPPFEVFRHLDGVQAAARVLRTRGNVVVAGKSAGQGIVMGIDNTTFGDVAWFRRDLYPVHPNLYLNALGYYEQDCLIPTSFAEEYQLKVGDVISIELNQQAVEFAVAGIVPYWPSQYPDEMPFFIANLDYIYDQVPLIPYEVWLKMEDGAKVLPIYNELTEAGIDISSIQDVRNELIKQKQHPARGGVFGILSLGFLISVLVSLIGYVLYWFFNLSGRTVQFGVLRAMGLSRMQLTGMLLLEQIFTAGLSIGLGVGIGKLASFLFLPFLQTAESAEAQVPPFHVIFSSRDTFELFAVVVVMMLTGAALLFLNIRKLRVHQAVKLGEER